MRGRAGVRIDLSFTRRLRANAVRAGGGRARIASTVHVVKRMLIGQPDLVFPLSGVVAASLAVVVLSYRQTARVYTGTRSPKTISARARG
jgi:hypothetical protein